MKGHPPKRALQFLRWYCRADCLDEVEGDLLEIFQEQYEVSPNKAKRQFTWSVIRHFRPEFIRSFRLNVHPNSIAMFRNYLKTGWRNMARHKVYSAINIGGLTLGLAACMVIALFIRHEISYDEHYPDADRLYRVIGAFNIGGELSKNTYFPAPMAAALKKDFPEIESTGRLLASDLVNTKSKIRRADKTENIFEENIVYADQELVKMLGLHFTNGNIDRALDEPNTIAISKSKAEKYFPGEDPLGKNLVLNDDLSKPYRIGGVFDDLPSHSHLQFEFVLTMTGKELWPGEQTEWRANIYHNYLKVRSGTDKQQLEKKLTAGIIQTYMLASWTKGGMKNAKELANNVHIELQPVSDIHLKSKGIHDGLIHGDIRLIWIFGAVACFVLIIAGINFINLSTARSSTRAKEIGLRKVVGSLRRNLVTQFLTESVLFSFISLLLATAITWLVLPRFNEFFDTNLLFPWKEWWLAPIVIIAAFIVGIMAGLYPSIYLSGFMPVKVFKGGFTKGCKNASMRNTLVVFQFCTSIILIIGTLIVYRQLNFILNRDSGFSKDQVLLIHGTGTIGDRLPAFKNELLTLPGVSSVSISEFLPTTETTRRGYGIWKKGKQNLENPVGAQLWPVDQDYIKTLGMQIVEGRDFNNKMGADSNKVVINQAMVKALGWDNPLGREITSGGETWQIIGVVKDFHFESLTENIEPLCLTIGNSPSIVSVRVNTNNMQPVVKAVESSWSKFVPNESFRYGFLDQSLYGDRKSVV